ncbi:MAG: LysR family transcriptional regulator, partial [Alphaproteobacteria bacterium]
MDWDKLRIFHAVAAAGSFTHAGEQLHLSQSAVSRQVSALEETLNCALFHRHARGLLLTEQGEVLYRTVHDVFTKLSMAEAMLTDTQARPSGPLKVNTTVALGSLWLTPRLKEFLGLYPDIQLTLLTTDEELDLGMRQADCAIRVTPPRQPDLIRRRLTQVHTHIFASPEYIKSHGMPDTPEDLDDHKLIVFGDDVTAPAPQLNWLLSVETRGRDRNPVLKLNNIYGIFRAVQSGLGLAALPDFLANEMPTLVRVLPTLEGPTYDAYFVYPEELRHSRRIAVFRDFLIRKMA